MNDCTDSPIDQLAVRREDLDEFTYYVGIKRPTNAPTNGPANVLCNCPAKVPLPALT